jgi:hypothetical protein
MIKWDRRKNSNSPQPAASDLPVDYLRLVEQTLTQALEPGLIEMRKTHPVSEFAAGGAIYADEVLLAITLSHGVSNLSATTLYASADFNPLADKPGLEATLSACLDAVGTIFEYYLDTAYPERITQLGHHSLSALEEAPFEWTAFEPSSEAEVKVAVHVKMDKSNPQLDSLTEKWLMENDPHYKENLKKETVEVHGEAEDFLSERLDAIKKAGSGSGNGGGPITH